MLGTALNVKTVWKETKRIGFGGVNKWVSVTRYLLLKLKSKNLEIDNIFDQLEFWGGYSYSILIWGNNWSRNCSSVHGCSAWI